ncbi:MAG: hypothetical protein ACOYK7_01695 [Pirellulales bacterium]
MPTAFHACGERPCLSLSVRSAAERGGRQARLRLGLAMIVLLVACHGRSACADDATPTSAIPTSAISTRRLLTALDERRMPDVALWVLDRIEADPAAPANLKREVAYRRAEALVALSRGEAAATKRAALLDHAGAEIDRFLKTGPEGDLAITAYLQNGNLLIERGRAKLEQAKRPGEDPAKLAAEAIGFFDAAIKVIEGPKRNPGEEITMVASAEDAVLKELRQVDARLTELSGDEGKEAGEGKPKRPPRRSAADAKLQEQLEARQDELRGQLLSTRLVAAGAYFEKSKALTPASAEYREALDAAASRYRELAEKYRSRGAGLFARYYEGRTYAAQALAEANADERKKRLAQALATLADIRGLEGESGIVPGLRAKAIGTSLECWLDEKNYDAFDERLQRLALATQPADRLDPDWLAMKYRAAALLEQRAAALPEADKAKRAPWLRDARKLAQEVAKLNKDFAREARALLERLGRALPDDSDGANSFAAAIDSARVALADMQSRQAALKQAQAAGQPTDEPAAAVAESRDKAVVAVRRAIPLAGPDDLEALNQARYWLTFLLYDSRRLHEAAAMGDFLASRYPNAKGGRQAATIAMASWQQLARSGPEGWRAAARSRCTDVAERIMRTWPADAESADAGVVAIAAATESRDGARLADLLTRVPANSPRRGELLLRGGGGLWREIQDQRRLPADGQLPAEQLAAWRSAAVSALDGGLAAIPEAARPDATMVAGALARAQIALEDGDMALAARLLEHPQYGPWKVVTSTEPDAKPLTEGPLAESVLSVALRFFIQASATDPAALGKAQRAMEQLEKLAGTGAEASAKLTAMYLSMGRDLEGQLRELAAAGGTPTPESQARVAAILGGFETFLDGVARRDSKTSAQMWVASTYLTLGSGGSGACRAKAAEYLGKSAKTYEALLAKGGDEVARFEPSLRMRLATVYGELGKWDEALGHIDWVLSDPKRQNALDVQLQAAELLQAAGEKVPDKSRADTLLREAIVGRRSGTSMAWGWGGIANKLSRQAFAGEDAKSLEARARFFDARYNVAAIRLARARKSDSERAKLLDMAASDIAITYKLYPGLGGDASRARFEKLLKEIQKERGSPNPPGLAELETAG